MGLPGKSAGFVPSRKGILSAQWFLATLDEHCQTSTSLQILIYNFTSSNIKHQTSKHYPENHVYYFLRQLHCVPFPTPLFESQKRLIFCILCLVFFMPLYGLFRRFYSYDMYGTIAKYDAASVSFLKKLHFFRAWFLEVAWKTANFQKLPKNRTLCHSRY